MRLEQRREPLLLGQPSGEERVAPAAEGRRVLRGVDEVRQEREPLARHAELEHLRHDEEARAVEELHLRVGALPRVDVGLDRARERQRKRAGVAAAERGVDEHAAAAALAHLALRAERVHRAQELVVVHRVHHRHAPRVQLVDDRRRELMRDVVQVRDVEGPGLAEKRAELRPCLAVVDEPRGAPDVGEPVAPAAELDPAHEVVHPRRGPIPGVLHRERNDRVAGRREQPLDLEHVGLGAGLGPVELVGREDLHRARAPAARNASCRRRACSPHA
jgi:hypothetical protein